jgi:hypothetical protein
MSPAIVQKVVRVPQQDSGLLSPPLPHQRLPPFMLPESARQIRRLARCRKLVGSAWASLQTMRTLADLEDITSAPGALV